MSAPQFPQLLQQTAIARELGVSPASIRGILERVPADGTVRGRPAWYIRSVLAPILGLQPDDNRGRLRPIDRKDWNEGTRLQLDYLQQTGELIDAEVARRQMALTAVNMVSLVESLPDHLERDYGATPAEVVRCQRLVDALREDAYTRCIQ